MGEIFKVTLKDVDFSFIKKDVTNILESSKTKLAINNEFARMCEPYVPMDSGMLAHNAVIITEDYVEYATPYAHYMYIGQVYGPNIPIVKNGQIVGWFSPKNKQKHPTGRAINYSTDRHPLASKEWDKAMMRDKGEDFMHTVELILYRGLKKKS